MTSDLFLYKPLSGVSITTVLYSICLAELMFGDIVGYNNVEPFMEICIEPVHDLS